MIRQRIRAYGLERERQYVARILGAVYQWEAKMGYHSVRPQRRLFSRESEQRVDTGLAVPWAIATVAPMAEA
jgi:hypothetical protein